MNIGDLVQTVGNFESLRKIYKFPYPKIGDILTISKIESHPNYSLRKDGIILLFFEELPDLVGVCDKTIENIPNFVKIEITKNLISEIEKFKKIC